MLYLFWTEGPAIGPLDNPVELSETIQLAFAHSEDAQNWQQLIGGEINNERITLPLSKPQISLANIDIPLNKAEVSELTAEDAYTINTSFFGSQLDFILQLSAEKYTALTSILKKPDSVASILHTISA